jgi:signal transduction histidine kinase
LEKPTDNISWLKQVSPGIDSLSIINDRVLVKNIIDSIQDIVLLVDTGRRILLHNKKFLELTGSDATEVVKGISVGEAINCVHSKEPPAGCGTTEACALCGFTKSILNLENGQYTEEVRIITNKDSEVLDLKVKSFPFIHDEQKYVVLIISDIKHEKRRKILERIFFHDVMNTAAGLKGLSELLTDSNSEEEIQKATKLINQASTELIDVLQAQTILISAENDEITVNFEEIHLKEFLQDKVDFYSSFKVARNKKINYNSAFSGVVIKSDIHILKRVIGNMIKNALEEIRPGEEITVGCCFPGSDEVEIWVHNPGYIKRDIQLQIFQRSFSTKGEDRGLGTYSMKMLTDKYLNGKISFTTDKTAGTKFRLVLNKISF